MTSDLVARVWQHKEGLSDGVHMLVYYECFEDIQQAIDRETAIKRYPRQWKLNLIEGFNQGWRDLYDEIVSGG